MRDTIQELLARAIEREGEEREAFLAQQDTAAREELESLLRTQARMGDFLEVPAVERFTPAPFEPDTYVGAYRVLRVLGSGGAATVYEAEQRNPRRSVALKVLHGGLGSESAQRRFQDEAQILARLEHPDIAHVYEAGFHEGVPYFAMEYVTDAVRIGEHARALDLRGRLALFARVCDAIHHGHQKGVIHRDIKPANVLVYATGQPKIIDFGIARTEGADTEEIAGTVPYMSPEQFDPDAHADVRTDVYSLGVLLYELLTGALPYELEGVPLTEASRIIREEPPHALRRPFRGDLESILRRALAKDREDRYASAAALGDDVRRYLARRPVEAHPAGLLYQLRKFSQRHRTAFLAIAAVVVVSVAAAVVSIRMAVEKERQRDVAETERGKAEFLAYVANLAAANAALGANNVGEARLRLESAPAAHRNWEWRHLHGRLDTSLAAIVDGGRLAGVGLSPDGRMLAALSWQPDRVVVRSVEADEILYTIETASRRPDALAFHPDGTRLAVAYQDGGVEIRLAADGGLRHELAGHADEVTMVAYAPAGDRLATCSYDSTIKIWDTDTGRLVRTLEGHHGKIFCVRFGPRGERLYSGGGDACVKVWDAATGTVLATLEGHDSNVEDLAVSPDGTRLVTGSMDHTVRLWDLAARRELAAGHGHRNGVKAVAFGPGGRTVTSASIDRTVRLWDARDGAELATMNGHTDRVYGVVYAPRGDRIVSCSMDGTLRWWRAAAAESVPSLQGHGRTVTRLFFGDDGARLLSEDASGAWRLWDIPSRTELAAAPVDRRFALGPRGTRLFVLGAYRNIEVRAVADGTVLDQIRDERGGFGALLRVGTRLFVTRTGGWVQIWDTETYECVREWLARTRDPSPRLAVDPSGRFVAASTVDNRVDLWSAETAEELGSLDARDFERIVLSPDGRTIAATTREDNTIRLVDWRSGRRRATLRGHAGLVHALAFSPDGTRLASGGYDGTVRLWDAERGVPVLVLHAHLLSTTSLAWSADGRVLASGGGDWFPEACVIRLWEATPSGGGGTRR